MKPSSFGFVLSASAALLFAMPAFAGLFPGHKADTITVEAALDGVRSDTGETNLGDLVADAVRQTAQCDIALVPADELTTTIIPAGAAAPKDIVQTLRYADDASDTIVILSLTGAQLLKAVERSVSRAPQPFNGFLQVSGLQIRYNASAPNGKRVGLVGAAGSELNITKIYKVAVPRSLADGGLGYFQIWDKKDIASSANVTMAASMTDYLANHKTLSGARDGRIAANP